MAGARSTNTFSEFLQRLLGDVSAAKIMPDADLQWIVELETMIVQKARDPITAMQSAGTTQSPMQPGMGAMPPMPGPAAMPPGMPMPTGAGAPAGGAPGGDPMAAMMAQMGGGSSIPVPSPGRDQGATGMDDELRRMVGQ